MEEMSFVWDENKNRANIKKHNISFAEASTVFYDPEAILVTDDDHSDYEERFIIMGLSEKFNQLAVCHCCKNSDTIIRIISARYATPKETTDYVNNKGNLQ